MLEEIIHSEHPALCLALGRCSVCDDDYYLPWMQVSTLTCILAKWLQSSDSCDPTDCSPPNSSDHGILQARILEWVAMRSSRGSS